MVGNFFVIIQCLLDMISDKPLTIDTRTPLQLAQLGLVGHLRAKLFAEFAMQLVNPEELPLNWPDFEAQILVEITRRAQEEQQNLPRGAESIDPTEIYESFRGLLVSLCDRNKKAQTEYLNQYVSSHVTLLTYVRYFEEKKQIFPSLSSSDVDSWKRAEDIEHHWLRNEAQSLLHQFCWDLTDEEGMARAGAYGEVFRLLFPENVDFPGFRLAPDCLEYLRVDEGVTSEVCDAYVLVRDAERERVVIAAFSEYAEATKYLPAELRFLSKSDLEAFLGDLKKVAEDRKSNLRNESVLKVSNFPFLQFFPFP